MVGRQGRVGRAAGRAVPAGVVGRPAVAGADVVREVLTQLHQVILWHQTNLKEKRLNSTLFRIINLSWLFNLSFT